MNARVATLTILALICGVLISGLFSVTRVQIRDNRQDYAELQLRQVVQDESVELRQIDTDHYLILDDARSNGMVFRYDTTSGYNGNISLWIATLGSGNIRNVRVIDHRETPGIGDLIDRDTSDWIDQFSNKSLQNPGVEGWHLSHEGGIYDHVSGATITTRAVVRAVQAGLREMSEAGP